jgi:hypothetical protein
MAAPNSSPSGVAKPEAFSDPIAARLSKEEKRVPDIRGHGRLLESVLVAAVSGRSASH